jgi:predicted NBD/HSP70 family sugar kinase
MQNELLAGGSLVLSGNRSASNRTPRQINRNLIFNLVRLLQPISRAELARRSGLRRSTVSLIVEELINEEWLFEGAIGQLPRGRRPILIQLSEKRGVIVLDVHPQRTTIGVANLSGKILVQDAIDLSLDSQQSLGAIKKGILDLIAAHEAISFVGVGICLPGRTDPELQTLVFAPRLNWPAINLKAHIEQATELPVEIDNVANACALAEIWFGNSDAHDGLMVVNVSEGISVGIFVNGKILRGHQGMAGEFGHVQMQAEGGVLCACGNFGCWETLASNTAALRYHREFEPERPAESFKELVARAMEGESAAVKALTTIALELGRGIRTLLSGLAPKEIVVVGDVAPAWSLVGPIVESEMRQGFLTTLPLLRCTSDGNDARLRGAVALTLSKGTV